MSNLEKTILAFIFIVVIPVVLIFFIITPVNGIIKERELSCNEMGGVIVKTVHERTICIKGVEVIQQ